MKARQTVMCLLATLLIAATAANAEDPVNIPDPGLKAVIEAQLGIPNPTPTDMLGLTSLGASNLGIAGLTGLEHARNLDALDLSRNDINNLDPLAGLTNLTRLRLSNNHIADTRPLAGLTNLAELYLDNDYQGHYDWNAPNQNQIRDIGPLAGLTQLKSLDLGRNEVGDASALSGMTKLTWLSLCYNQITDVSGLAGLRSLTYLDIGGNQINDLIPLKDLVALDRLSVRFDPITDVTPLKNLTALKELNMEGTLVTDITALASLKNLQWFQASYSPVASLEPLRGLTNLTWLGFYGSRSIHDISPLAGLTKLQELTLNSNYVTDVTPLSGLAALINLSIAENGLADIRPLANLTNLRSLDLRGNQISDTTPLGGLTSLVDLRAGGNQIVDIAPVAGLTRLERLELQGNRIEDCRWVADLTRLTYLHLGSNRISSLSCLSGLTDLEFLFLYDNQITDIARLSGLTNLSCLNCGGNQIVDVSPLSTLTGLRSLALNSNRISDITTLAALSSVQGLDLENNLIEDISPLAGLTGLTSLNLGINTIADISALTGMISLSELWLSGNPLDVNACAVDIPLIKAKNPGVVVHYDGCTQWWTLIVSSTEGGSVAMPGEDVFTYLWGDLAPVEAVAEEGYQFTHWSGSAVDANAMLDPYAPHTSVIMDGDYSLVAHFKPQDQPWSTVYFNDFERRAGPEWTHSVVDLARYGRDATLIGARQFLGQFNNDTVTLTLANLAVHSDVRVSFDLFVLRSWDGDGLPDPLGVYSTTDGPDVWSVNVQDGPTLLRTTFDNHWTPRFVSFHRQSYPQAYPYGESLPQTGAAERNTLGFGWDLPDTPEGKEPTDSVYHLRLSFAHSSPSIQLVFSDLLSRAWVGDESWGLDNVRVEVLAPAEPKATLMVSATAGGSVTAPGEGTFPFDKGTSVAVQAVAKENYHFTDWSGSAVAAGKVADPASASTTVLVDGDYTLVANFAVDQKTLTVSAGPGGSVAAPGEGSFQYAQGASVAVQAAAKAHYYFTHWSGAAVDAGKVADPASANTTVTVDADYTLAAHFKIDQHRLTVSAAAGGYIYVETRTGNATTPWYDLPVPLLDHGTQVTVIATPYGGWKFTGWSGTMGSTESPFTFELTQDCNLEALFVPE